MTATKRLFNKTKGVELATQVRVADSFFSRAKGLLGESHLSEGSALWIKGSHFVACNSIHTWFMRFSIDAIFVDRGLTVKGVYRDLAPWRMTLPIAGATSVFEFPAGTVGKSPVEIGDQLYVGD
jgi:uncharacterized membrane protein (UPF0127 family)